MFVCLYTQINILEINNMLWCLLITLEGTRKSILNKQGTPIHKTGEVLPFTRPGWSENQMIEKSDSFFFGGGGCSH